MKRSGWTVSSAGMMGAFLGASGVLLIVLTGNDIRTPEAATVYAAVIAGFFALVTVGGAIYAVQVQVNAQAELLDQQRLARLEAERAMLPVILEILLQHCDERINRLVKLGHVSISIEVPSLLPLQSCIELSVGVFRQQLVDIVAIFSISDAVDKGIFKLGIPSHVSLDTLLRIEAAESKGEFSEFLVKLIFQWAAVRARVSNLFPFSYGAVGEPQWEPIFEKFHDYLASISKRKLPEGLELCEYDAFKRLKLKLKGEDYQFCRKDWRQVTLVFDA